MLLRGLVLIKLENGEGSHVLSQKSKAEGSHESFVNVKNPMRFSCLFTART